MWTKTSRMVVAAIHLSWLGCAHMNRQLAPDEAHIYSVSEEELRPKIIEWFRDRRVFLEPTENPHVFVSRFAPPRVVGGTSSEPSGWGKSAAEVEVEATTRDSTWGDLQALMSNRESARSQGEAGPTIVTGYSPSSQASERWRIELVPLTERKTMVRLFRFSADLWLAGADQSYLRGMNDPRVPVTLQGTTHAHRAHHYEAKLAGELDFTSTVEVLGERPLDGVTAAEVEPFARQQGPRTLDCSVALDQFRFAPGAVVLLGDLSGTQETPRALRELLCLALREGHPVTAMLSIAAGEQQRINRFLASAGAEADRTALLAGPFWRRPWQDGRSSEAILEALESLRAWRESGLPVAVLAADFEGPARGNARSAFIASRIVEHRRLHRDRVLVGLFSNTLGSARAGASWDQAYLPVGYRLLSADVPVQSFDVSYSEGQQWTCHLGKLSGLQCGTFTAHPGPKQVEASEVPRHHPALAVFESRSEEGYDGLLSVGRVTPSAPAVKELTRDDGHSIRREDSPR